MLIFLIFLFLAFFMLLIYLGCLKYLRRKLLKYCGGSEEILEEQQQHSPSDETIFKDISDALTGLGAKENSKIDAKSKKMFEAKRSTTIKADKRREIKMKSNRFGALRIR